MGTAQGNHGLAEETDPGVRDNRNRCATPVPGCRPRRRGEQAQNPVFFSAGLGLCLKVLDFGAVPRDNEHAPRPGRRSARVFPSRRTSTAFKSLTALAAVTMAVAAAG